MIQVNYNGCDDVTTCSDPSFTDQQHPVIGQSIMKTLQGKVTTTLSVWLSNEREVYDEKQYIDQ